jgi:4-hydroxythreonine-4-phosphate dehydrogenase
LPEQAAYKPRIGITTGDPAGVGPEVSLRAAAEAEFGKCRLVLFGGRDLLEERARELGLPFPYESVAPETLHGGRPLPERAVVDLPVSGIVAGTGSRASGAAAARNVCECAAACLRGNLDAMVTAPLNKRFFQEAGYDFPGHTEFLAQLAGAREIAMAFLTERLRVVLATIHSPLRTVVDTLSPDIVYGKLRVLLTEFPRLGLPCRRVAVAGLNPHAGEGGIMGSEEEDVILPAIERARAEFPAAVIEGPLPADTLFWRAWNGEFDVVLAMYHDQGLGPIKLIGFGETVNVTLGLPFVRTSVDHGTAYDIAGKGTARHDSMNSAIRWALRLAAARARCR